MNFARRTFFPIALCFLGVFQIASSAELVEDLQGVWRAKVERVISQEEQAVPGTRVKAIVQELQVRLLEGERKGELIAFENDYIELKEGDTFYLNYLITIEGDELYSVREIDRRGAIYFLI